VRALQACLPLAGAARWEVAGTRLVSVVASEQADSCCSCCARNAHLAAGSVVARRCTAAPLRGAPAASVACAASDNARTAARACAAPHARARTLRTRAEAAPCARSPACEQPGVSGAARAPGQPHLSIMATLHHGLPGVCAVPAARLSSLATCARQARAAAARPRVSASTRTVSLLSFGPAAWAAGTQARCGVRAARSARSPGCSARRSVADGDRRRARFCFHLSAQFELARETPTGSRRAPGARHALRARTRTGPTEPVAARRPHALAQPTSAPPAARPALTARVFGARRRCGVSAQPLHGHAGSTRRQV
jgi:hypothetical protein